MKRIIALLVTAIMFSALSLPAMSASIYQANLPVLSQGDDERVEAVRSGFQQLLIKLTGDPSVVRNPTLKEAIMRANYFVADVSYGLPTPQSSTYQLHVHYSEPDIRRLLNRAGVTFWEDNRPSILIWLAVTDKQNNTEIIGEESQNTIMNNLKHQSNKLGLPLIYPLMDVADISQVSVADVTGTSLATLELAGKRYSPNGYLVGKIAPVDNGFESEWELILDKNHWKWTANNRTMDTVIIDAMAETSQTLAKHFANKS